MVMVSTPATNSGTNTTDSATTEEAIYDLISSCDITEKYLVTAQVTSPQTTRRYTRITSSELKKSFDNADRQERRST